MYRTSKYVSFSVVHTRHTSFGDTSVLRLLVIEFLLLLQEERLIIDPKLVDDDVDDEVIVDSSVGGDPDDSLSFLPAKRKIRNNKKTIDSNPSVHPSTSDT